MSEDLFFLLFTWFWVKIRTKFEWRPIFFWSSPDFGQKFGLNISGDRFLYKFSAGTKNDFTAWAAIRFGGGPVSTFVPPGKISLWGPARRLILRKSRPGLSCVIKSNLSLYSLFYAEACNEFAMPTSASLRPGNTAAFEMSQRWRNVGNIVSDLTGPRVEPQTFHSRDERVTARPTGWLVVQSFHWNA